MSIPSHFGRYRVLRALASGEMGVVYLAEDPLIGRKVAIKAIRMDPHTVDADVQGLQERFKQEIQIAGTFAHPNIVILFDVGHQDGRTFIAMEYVEGRNLRAELQASGPFRTKRVVKIIAPVCEALSYAHERGIIHRDIKPTNVLLSEEGVPKITDFGVARLMGSTLTRSGKIFGTPAYMSPEQAIGGPLTGASDQFAVATLAYELLTGERPFKGTSPTSVIYEVIESHPPGPDELAPLVPSPVAEVVMRGLMKNPKERFDSCADFGAAITEALEWTQANPNLAYLGKPPQLKDKVSRSAASLLSGEFFSMEAARQAWNAIDAGARRAWRRTLRETRSVLAQPGAQLVGGVAALATAVVLLAATWSALGNETVTEPHEAAAATPIATTLQPAAGATGGRGDGILATPEAPPAAAASDVIASDPLDPIGSVETLRFRVTSQPPGALVTFDGIPVGGATPVHVNVGLEGDHILRLELDGYSPLSWRFSAGSLNDRHFESGALHFPLTRIVAVGEPASQPVTLDTRALPWALGDHSPARSEPAPSSEVESSASALPIPGNIADVRRLKAPAEAPKPAKLHHVEPLVSTAADGVVVLEIEVSARGNVVQAKVLRGMGPEFDRAALEAVVRWKYAPPTLDGEPVHVLMTVSMRFSAS